MIFWNQARKRKEFKLHKRVTVFGQQGLPRRVPQGGSLFNRFCFPYFLLLLKHTNIQNDSFNFLILPFFSSVKTQHHLKKLHLKPNRVPAKGASLQIA